jgi:DNA-3-methyladenine glycosylase I
MRLDARNHHAQGITISVVPVVANRSDIPEVPAAAGPALRRLPAQGRQEGRVETGGVGMSQMTVDMNRCPWAKTDPYVEYHDSEWGVPVHDDRLLLEFLILEGAQAGLSWETILKKRENYRAAFDQFDPAIVAEYGQKKRTSLLSDAGIVRNRLKIAAAIQNAKMFLAVQNEFGTFDNYIWGFVGNEPKKNAWKSLKDVPAKTLESDAMSKDLKRRGFKFVGSTICYAFMQAVGMVNDHLVGCSRHGELSKMDRKPQ